jgi:hypothetical protein
MLELVQSEKVTAVFMVPSQMQVLTEYPEFDESFALVRFIVVVGESASLALYLFLLFFASICPQFMSFYCSTMLFDEYRCKRLGKRAYNLYGPTEASILSTSFDYGSVDLDEKV